MLTAKPYTFKIQYLDNGKLQTLAKRKVDLAQYCSCEQQGHTSAALDLECVPSSLRPAAVGLGCLSGSFHELCMTRTTYMGYSGALLEADRFACSCLRLWHGAELS